MSSIPDRMLAAMQERDRDPRKWSTADVDVFCADASVEEVASAVATLARVNDDDALRVLAAFLGARMTTTYDKPVPSRAAVHALIALGEAGVRVLRDALVHDEGRRARYKGVIVEALFRASRREPLPWAPAAPRPAVLDELHLGEDAADAAYRGLRDVLAEARVNPEIFSYVADFLQRGQLAGDLEGVDDASFGRAVLRLLSDASIRLSPSLLEEYEQLLSSGEREETFQRFLARHPVFLDPLSGHVVSKQRLGLELATDFAVQRLDSRWVLVEIEKPQTPIFTRQHDFHSEFTHAFGQVLDFQQWVDDNVAYAQRHMSDITAPRGLLVTGMRASLHPRALAKLRQFNDNSARIDVVTFDDLLVGARNLYANIIHRDDL